MKSFILLLISSMALTAYSQDKIQVPMTQEQYQAFLRTQGGSGTGMGGVGCFQSMLENTSQSIGTTLETRTQETNTLMGLSQQYFEQEQQCGNDLSQAVVELNNAKAEHNEQLMMMPAKIELQRLEYEQAVLSVQQECEQSSGAAFMEWKQMVSSGVVTPERGGPMALFGRSQNINRFQKLFYDDCLANRNNVKRVELLGRQLATNVKMLQAGIDASAMKLANLTENLSFNQGRVVKNCMRAKKQLDYQAKLARNNAAAANSAAKTNNFLRMLSGVGVCIQGIDPNKKKASDTTAAGV